MKRAGRIAVLLVLFARGAQSATREPELSILLKPLVTGKNITGIEVASTLVDGVHQAAEPVAEVAFVTFNVPAPVTEIVGPEAADQDGIRASDDHRSLDDLVLKMLARRRAGHTLVRRDWEDIVRGELGGAGVAAFHAMLAAEKPLPEADAFGSCFRQITKQMRRYELGFEPAALAEPHRIVRGLIADSAAQKAGLRNGDEITMPVGQDRIQGDQPKTIGLAAVRRLLSSAPGHARRVCREATETPREAPVRSADAGLRILSLCYNR